MDRKRNLLDIFGRSKEYGVMKDHGSRVCTLGFLQAADLPEAFGRTPNVEGAEAFIEGDSLRLKRGNPLIARQIKVLAVILKTEFVVARPGLLRRVCKRTDTRDRL